MIRIPAPLTLFICLCITTTSARPLHVDAATGNDRHDGRTPATAFRTIQRAADVAQPGDEIVIHPGIYFEHVTLREDKRGTPSAPIIFRADRIAKNRVILSGAAPGIRTGKTHWELVDPDAQLYAAPYSGLPPARVTYSHVDLYPYLNRDTLNTFTLQLPDNATAPGPRHGFFYDAIAKKLYLRLHPSGQYGSTDPDRHSIAVSPKAFRGSTISIQGQGPAHIIIEGITFETPGDTAIATTASNITIRDNWFFGAPYAVRGNNKGEARKPDANPYATASDITIEHCEYTEFSTWNDATELLRELKLQPGRRAPWSAIWHRKTTGRYGLPANTKNYENGIAVRIGRGWTIRNNHIHDTFEGLANDGMGNAVDVSIHDNVFARICDNAIETENHSRNVRIYRNHFLDVLEPFSYQPGGGPPWPGPLYFYQNIVENTPEHAALWQPAPHGGRGVFKIGISLKNWNNGRNADVPKSPLAAPLPGLFFFNNTITFPGGRLFTLMGSRNVPIRNVHFTRNIIATDFVLSKDPAADLPAGSFTFARNHVSPATPGQPGPAPFVAGDDTEPPEIPIPVPPLPDTGALQPGDTWFPPKVGPRET
ncbi:MAG: right-handed parallel beta-helix repeat-containing protein [Opitutaceae bacterium]|jgi:hypothetical protein|nr:right-handed parallel beta-helix repeat-containing protein [Opitutaceae bacterium]